MNKRTKTPWTPVALVLMLAGVLSVAWAKPQNVFEQLDLLVDVRHELVQGYVEEPDQAALIEAAIKGMVSALDDPYTTYLTQDELDPFDRYVRGTFSGIGAEVDLHEARPRIVTPLEDSPAWNAGVLAGDVILEIDGEDTLDLSLTEAVRKLTGERGTQVTIRVRHESGEERDITITRDVINIQTVRGFRRIGDGQYDLLLDDDNRIGYVRVTQFSERTAGELRNALEQLKRQDARGLILDLRFNPGGLLQSAVEVSDMFLTGGQPIVSVKGRVVPEQSYASSNQTLMPDLPIVVLANEASASAAEIVAGALSDNDRALFVGTRTFGKGSVQQVKMLESGAGALKFTTAYYYIPSGRMIHRRPTDEVWGVDPRDGAYIPMTPQQVRAMADVRRQGDVLRRRTEADTPPPVSAEWIETELMDPQLAAGLRAMLGKLSDGEWPTVGVSVSDHLVQQARRANLAQRRDALRERLQEVERELASLDRGEDVAVDDTDAEAADAASPIDPAAVRDRIDATERQIIGEQTAPTEEDAQ
jgi:carboxyl-terminal processing protease